MWFWLSAVAGIASASDKVLTRIALKDRGNIVAYSFLYMTAISIFSLPFSLPLNINFGSELAFLVIIQAVFWSLGTLFSFLSQARTDVSLSMIISRARMLWMVPLGVVFLNEIPNLFSVVGILMIFLGFLVLFYKKQFHKHRGLHFMAISSLFVAFGSIVNAILVRNYLTPAQTTLITMASQSGVFAIMLLIRKGVVVRIKEVVSSSMKILLIAAFVETFAFFGLNYAYRVGIASLSSAVYLGMTITTVWIGIIFLKERDNMARKLVSSAIIFLGIIIAKISG